MNGENDYKEIYVINLKQGYMASDNPSSLCSRFFKDIRNQWGESINGATFIKEFDFQGRCTGYFNHDLWGGANKDWISANVSIEKMKKSEYNSGGECQENGLRQFSNARGKFSVVCTYKHKPKEEKPTVGSTSSSSDNVSSDSSNSTNSSSAGGGGGGGGSSASTTATTPDGGMQGGGKDGGSGQSGTTGTGTGTTGTGTTGTGTTGTGTGTGSDSSGDLGDMPSAPDGGGEPDWGGLKSDGGFGTFSPSSAFSTGGYCPQDIQLDFGQFGRHSLTLSFVCEAAEKLRYVFITLAYFTSAMMIFKTVNSMKG